LRGSLNPLGSAMYSVLSSSYLNAEDHIDYTQRSASPHFYGLGKLSGMLYMPGLEIANHNYISPTSFDLLFKGGRGHFYRFFVASKAYAAAAPTPKLLLEL